MNRVLVIFVAGLLMGMTAAPVNAWYLTWFALAPLWIAVVQLRPQNFKRIILLGAVWALAYHGQALFWITGVHPMTWMGVPWLLSLLIAIFCWLFITFWGVLLVAAWCLGMVLWQRFKDKYHSQTLSLFGSMSQAPEAKIILRIIFGVAWWCILEGIWSQGSLWWTSLSFSQSPNNLSLLHLTQLSGPTTLTAAIVAVNGILAEIFISTRNNKLFVKNTFFLLLIPIAIYSGLFWVGSTLYHRPLKDVANNAVHLGIIQGNIPNEIKLNPVGWRKAIAGYTRGYQSLAQKDLDAILTPETALPFRWQDIQANSSFYETVQAEKIPTFLGAFRSNQQKLTNSLLALDQSGKLVDSYDKIKLVPLGEYIPFESILGNFISRLSPLEARLLAGNPQQRFNTPIGQVIAGICYDSAFSDVFRRQAQLGGEVILTAANNAHYSQIMPAQHHAQDIMRAVESDRWLARATNTGYSAIINPKGETIWLSSINTYELHSDTIFRRQTQTLYVRFGDWLIWVLFFFGLATLVL